MSYCESEYTLVHLYTMDIIESGENLTFGWQLAPGLA